MGQGSKQNHIVVKRQKLYLVNYMGWYLFSVDELNHVQSFYFPVFSLHHLQGTAPANYTVGLH